MILLVGDNCGHFLDTKIRNVEVKDVQVDEIWSFVGCKNKTAAIKFAWYNFCRNHSTIGMTPAVASGLAVEAWTIKQLLERAVA